MAKLSTRSTTHLCWCNLRIFEGKMQAAGKSPRGSCSCTTMPRATGHLQPRTNWHIKASSVLITHPILRIWPRRTITYSLDWKTIERSPFFFRRGGQCCRGEVAWRTTCSPTSVSRKRARWWLDRHYMWIHFRQNMSDGPAVTGILVKVDIRSSTTLHVSITQTSVSTIYLF